jgi:hypothetical protein
VIFILKADSSIIESFLIKRRNHCSLKIFAGFQSGEFENKLEKISKIWILYKNIVV